MSSRTNVLVDLLELQRPLLEVAELLAKFPWDSEEELVRLTEENVADAVRRFLDGQLSGDEIHRWAGLIACREDIDYEGFEDLIMRLATPEINHPLDRAIAVDILASLGTSDIGS